MAATYRLVISSVNCYSSVVVDRRSQEAVHYCDGPCGLLRHGLECMVAHRGLCSETVVTQSPVTGELAEELPVLDVGSSSHLSNYRFMNEGKHPQHMSHAISAFRGESSVQTPISLKDITSDAINLACGKVKEFSFGHVPLRRGRKVRLDPFCRRTVDADLAGGHISRNDENCPPFCLLPRPQSEHLGKLTPAISSEQDTSQYPNRLTEENLITQILELTKNDTGTTGEDIRSCLNILLKCSDDLKKCTNIIRQCIKRKSFVEGNRDQGNEAINEDMMARLSSHLKKFPLGFECGLSGSQGLSNPPKLVNSLHELQQALFCNTFEDEQPPRYEDVVCCMPPINALNPSHSLPDDEASEKDSYKSEKSVQQLSSLVSQVISPVHRAQCDFRVSSHSNMPGSHINNHDESGQLKYTVVESHEAEISDRSGDREVKFHTDFAEFESKVPVEQTNLTAADVLENSWTKTSVRSQQLQCQGFSEAYQYRERISDDTDEVIVDLENLSCNTDKEFRNCGQQTDYIQCSIFDMEAKNPKAPKVSPETQSKLHTVSPGCPGEFCNTGEISKNEDGALLLHILEKIENFAQELAESSETITSRAGSLAQEQEGTSLLHKSLPENITMCTTGVKPQADNIEEYDSIKKVQQTQDIFQNEETFEPVAPASRFHPPGDSSTVTDSVAASVPTFYFPQGVPQIFGATFGQTIAQIEAVFREFEEQKVTIHEMGKIAKACECPLYWKAPLFHSAGGGQRGFITSSSLMEIWRRLSCGCYDDSSKFVYLLAKANCNYLEQDDFIPLLQDIVDSHPGLTFLMDAPEFHSWYITTVIQRIFYRVNRSWTGKITISELRRSNFLQTLTLLEEENDINQITDYFSYEHFYVIYCKFWELDSDHNLYIDQQDLARYNCQASSKKIIKRLFSGAVTRGSSALREGRMSYAEFVWFLISEEDKRTPTSVEYWFRCMDLDGDGVLSMYELDHFYQEQHDRLEAMGVEPLPFHDMLCQVLDLVRPQQPGKITLWDLKRCGMAHVFYDTFFSLEKYLEHEQRDPFAVQKDVNQDGQEMSDWDRFASEEYEVLVAEESESEHLEDGSSEDDPESEKPIDSLEVESEMDKLVDSDSATQS